MLRHKIEHDQDKSGEVRGRGRHPRLEPSRFYRRETARRTFDVFRQAVGS